MIFSTLAGSKVLLRFGPLCVIDIKALSFMLFNKLFLHLLALCNEASRGALSVHHCNQRSSKFVCAYELKVAPTCFAFS